MEPSSLDFIVNCSYKEFFAQNYVICGNKNTGSNWAKGYNAGKADLIDATMNMLRKVADECNRLQGFLMIHSLGGGTGSAFGSLLTSKVKEEFRNKIMCNYSLFPSENMSEIVVEPYNVTLSVPSLIESSNLTVMLDNKALSKICSTDKDVKESNYQCINELVAASISGVTAGLRFPGQLNADLKKLSVNLIPFPELHFLVTSSGPSPNCANKSSQHVNYNVPKIMEHLFNPNLLMASCNTSQGRYLATSVIFRGIVSTMEIEEEMMRIQTRLKDNFVDWLPSNVCTAVCDIAPPGIHMCGTLLGNTTAIKSSLVSVIEKCSEMLHQKAFLHWYTEEGLTETDFEQALEKIKTLTNNYLSFEKNVDDNNPQDQT